jgi:hypothetical protein
MTMANRFRTRADRDRRISRVVSLMAATGLLILSVGFHGRHRRGPSEQNEFD